jgi:hypothetical protein
MHFEIHHSSFDVRYLKCCHGFALLVVSFVMTFIDTCGLEWSTEFLKSRKS